MARPGRPAANGMAMPKAMKFGESLPPSDARAASPAHAAGGTHASSSVHGTMIAAAVWSATMKIGSTKMGPRLPVKPKGRSASVMPAARTMAPTVWITAEAMTMMMVRQISDRRVVCENP